MAGWISSKLKVAETLLQQIDQQAAESLGNNERPPPPPDALPQEPPKRSDSVPALKFQIPKKSPPPSTVGIQSNFDPPLSRSSDLAVAEGDWTELLGSPEPRSDGGKKPSIPLPPSYSRARNGWNPRRKPVRRVNTKIPSPSRVSSSDNGGAVEPPSSETGPVTVESKEAHDDLRGSVDELSSDSSSGSDSTSASDSEDEKQRRELMIAERVAAAAVEAIKERENVVARLEGEKQSLEKILEEREKEQAQEASELQLSMMETMDAVELETQKHNSTRMEALARLSKLETTNTELAKALAATQWNLELEVSRVAELQQQVDLKELAQEGHRRRMSKIHPGAPSLNEIEYSKKVELEKEILDAEYSLVCDKIAKLKDKAKKLEESIVITRNEILHPTEVELELKRRLVQLTDHLIQKQTQVEALSSEKATLTFRIETSSRSFDDDISNYTGIDLSEMADIEFGMCQPSKSAPSRALRSGRRRLGSALQQLDAVFSAGAVYLRRNPMAQLWSLLYILCLHLWVMYILIMSRSSMVDGATSGAVVSLEAINKTLGST